MFSLDKIDFNTLLNDIRSAVGKRSCGKATESDLKVTMNSNLNDN